MWLLWTTACTQRCIKLFHNFLLIPRSGGTSFNETTEEPMPYNNTGTIQYTAHRTNLTGLKRDWSVSKLRTHRLFPGPPNDLNRQEGGPRGSGMLIFMVTCLILCLMVVVIFIAIKLRKAHIAWKKGEQNIFTLSHDIICSLGIKSDSQVHRGNALHCCYCCNFL